MDALESLRKELFDMEEKILYARTLSRGENTKELQQLIDRKNEIVRCIRVLKLKLMEEENNEKYKGR